LPLCAELLSSQNAKRRALKRRVKILCADTALLGAAAVVVGVLPLHASTCTSRGVVAVFVEVEGEEEGGEEGDSA